MRNALPRTAFHRSGHVMALLVVICLSVVACSSSSAPRKPAASPPGTGALPEHPNIVFILTDDLSWNLMTPQIAPHIMELAKQGESFDHYFVDDSLCCPSRSSIFTGLFAHDTKVFTNLSPDGGFGRFQSENLDQRTYARSLHNAGYATSMLGKYLNGYGDPKMTASTAPVPPGWTDWHVSNNTGYAEFNFRLNDNGVYNTYQGQANYGVDVLNAKAQSFIKKAGGKPFAIEVATFAPHQPYTPAPRNANDFPCLTEPRDPSFNAATTDAPAWLGTRRPLSAADIGLIDRRYRKRAQAVESVDKLLADTEATLAAQHLTDDTYLVFSSDNGYHLGQHRLKQGKQTAFDTDIRVPLFIAGPGIPKGRVMPQVVQNVDLAPTFLQLSGGTPTGPMDGQSLVPLLHPSAAARSWPTVALIEHHGRNDNPADPDFEGGGSDPTSYAAIRISAKGLPGFTGPVEAVYVEYADPQHEVEYYDIAKDPYELHNTARALSSAQRGQLHAILTALTNCHSAPACRAAAHPEPAR